MAGSRRTQVATPARRLAFRVLIRLERAKPDRPAPRPDSLLAWMEDAKDGSRDGSRDRALARELVFGVLRWRRLLDHALDSYARTPVADLGPAVRTCLRLGLYQLRYLTRVPERAAVHETVSLTASVAGVGASRLVNAVLRAYLRAHHPWPWRGGDPSLYLRVGLSHPDWLVDRCLAALGPDGARARLEANTRVPRNYVRVRRGEDVAAVRRRLRDDGVASERFPLAPRCLRVIEGNPQQSPLHREGVVHIQDAGSQLMGWLLPVAGARRIADLCAAPGGKATILAERADPRPVLAGDLRPARISVLGRTVGRLRTAGVVPFVADAARPALRDGRLDRILVDAPCSGLGTLARNPDIKWTSSPERIAALGAVSRRILGAAARLLAPAGMLLYVVCSLEPEETSEVVASLLEEREDLARVPLSGQVPPRMASLVDEDGALRLAPEAHGTDGYFAALLIRRPGGTT